MKKIDAFEKSKYMLKVTSPAGESFVPSADMLIPEKTIKDSIEYWDECGWQVDANCRYCKREYQRGIDCFGPILYCILRGNGECKEYSCFDLDKEKYEKFTAKKNR